MAVAGYPRIRRDQLHHAAYRPGRDDGPGHLVHRRSQRDPLARCQEDRAGRTPGWAADASGEVGNTDHGRRPDLDCHRHHHPVVGRSDQPLRLGGADRHARLRRHRLVRRLEKGRVSRSEGIGQPLEIFLAVGTRAGGGRLSRLLGDGSGTDATDRAFPQDGFVSARRHRLRHPDLPGHRRHQQCGQLD